MLKADLQIEAFVGRAGGDVHGHALALLIDQFEAGGGSVRSAGDAGLVIILLAGEVVGGIIIKNDGDHLGFGIEPEFLNDARGSGSGFHKGVFIAS